MQLAAMHLHLPADARAAVTAALERWQHDGFVRRFWSGDPSLWTGDAEHEWLGWLHVVEQQLERQNRFPALAQDAQDAGFTHALLLGMGGSSLCPEVLSLTFGKQYGAPALHVLDSTDPAQIQLVEQRLDLARTLCIVSSKSGTTLEPNILLQYFHQRVQQALGPERAGRVGSHFLAITDPGSPLERIAQRERFRAICHGVPSIGGRYSALSDFGLVPAAIMGLDVHRLLERAQAMVRRCGAEVPASEHPGAALGAVLGALASQGRDKVTLIASPGIARLGAWLEQLLAESTGKEGKGLIPIDQEPLGPPEVYGADRLFVYLRLEGATEAAQEEAVAALERAGQPVVRLAVSDRYDLGAEFFRWEFATAAAGAILGINPFDQPDVEASKVETRKLTQAYEETGALPAEAPFFEGNGLRLYADAANTAALERAAGRGASLEDYLRAHLARLRPGDYVALLAYLAMTDEHTTLLQRLRTTVRDAKRVATCLGFGPRFLHSTGQAYKGGPNTGVFLQITCDDAVDLAVPGQRYTFGVVKAAQARGDFQVLAERGRRALRVHLGADVPAGLERLARAMAAAVE